MEVTRSQGSDGAGTLAELVRRTRLELRMTQRQAASTAGISLATWQAVERGGGGRFQELTLVSVAHALELPTEDVFEAAGEDLPRPAGGGTRRTPARALPTRESDDRDVDDEDVRRRSVELQELLDRLAETSYRDFLLVADHTRELARRLLADRDDR